MTREHRLSILRRSNGRFVLFLILDRSSCNCPNDRFRTITESLSTLRRPPERYALLMPTRPYKHRSPCPTVFVSPQTRTPSGTRWFRSRAGAELKSGGAPHAVSEMVESIRVGVKILVLRERSQSRLTRHPRVCHISSNQRRALHTSVIARASQFLDYFTRTPRACSPRRSDRLWLTQRWPSSSPPQFCVPLRAPSSHARSWVAPCTRHCRERS